METSDTPLFSRLIAEHALRDRPAPGDAPDSEPAQDEPNQLTQQ